MLIYLFLSHLWIMSGLIARDVFQSVLLSHSGLDYLLDKHEVYASNSLIIFGPVYLFIVGLFYLISE